MALRWWCWAAAWKVAIATCLDARCMEEEEAMELAQLRTQLLQVKMELASSQLMDESEGVYGKLRVDSPHWCAHIPWLVQFVVPPCWFGKPEKSSEPLGPDGKPAWCQHVSYGARPYVEECSDLGAAPKSAAPAPVPAAAAAPANKATTKPKKPLKPEWCARIPEAQKQYSPDCNDQVESLWLRQREANLAWRPAAAAAAALLEMDSSENSSTVVYGKLLLNAPHWCGYIPWLVQFVVPPCWFGKPAPSSGPLGPDGKPEWCKWVSPNAIQYVPECKGGMYDKGPDLGAPPPDAVPSKRRNSNGPNVKPGWCSHVPKENLRYVPDCSTEEESLW